MKTVIDELSLKIDVKVKKDIDKTISSIASAINKLNKAVSNVSALRKYLNTLNKISAKSFGITNVGNLNKGSKSQKSGAVPVETMEVASSSSKQQNAILKEYNNRLNIGNLEFGKRLSLNKKISSEIEKQNKKEEKHEKYQKKIMKDSSGVVSKMMRSLGRIALYRAARAIVSGIAKAASEGLENIRSVDSELDSSLTTLSKSFVSIKNSFATLLTPLIQAFQPFVTGIADALAGFINRTNEAKAALAGETKYTKILTSDSEEFKENMEDATSASLEFDKFSVLQKDGKEKYTGTVSANVTMTSDEAQSQMNLWNGIKTAIVAAGSALAISFGANALKKIKSLGEAAKKFGEETTKGTKALGKQKDASVSLAMVGLTAVASGITSIVSGWEEMGNVGRVLVPVISALATVLTAVIVLIKMGTGQWVRALSIAGIVGGSVATIGTALSTAIGFKDGGVPKTGTYFYAGEAGAEIVANTSGGKTGVTNISQFKTAMVEALAEYGVSQRGRTTDTVLQINGKEFARATAGDVANALSQKYRVDFKPR